MKKIRKNVVTALSGAAAGGINGLFGAGGGMVLVPLLSASGLKEEALFGASVVMMLPISLISLTVTALSGPLPWQEALPYLIGGAVGGLAAGRLGGKIPTSLLHRLFGLMLLWGGFRYLR